MSFVTKDVGQNTLDKWGTLFFSGLGIPKRERKTDE